MINEFGVGAQIAIYLVALFLAIIINGAIIAFVANLLIRLLVKINWPKNEKSRIIVSCLPLPILSLFTIILSPIGAISTCLASVIVIYSMTSRLKSDKDLSTTKLHEIKHKTYVERIDAQLGKVGIKTVNRDDK